MDEHIDHGGDNCNILWCADDIKDVGPLLRRDYVDKKLLRRERYSFIYTFYIYASMYVHIYTFN